jgi:hypothetical protein
MWVLCVYLDFVFVAMRAGGRALLFVHLLHSTTHIIVAAGRPVNRKGEHVC